MVDRWNGGAIIQSLGREVSNGVINDRVDLLTAVEAAVSHVDRRLGLLQSKQVRANGTAQRNIGSHSYLPFWRLMMDHTAFAMLN